MLQNFKKNIRLFIIGIIFILFPIFCNSLAIPNLNSFVTDNANILTAEQKNTLENKLKNIELNTTNQFVILTIKSLEGENLENYSINVARQNGIGQKNKDNGILILVSKEDRQIRIEVGYKLEEFVTDAKSSYIIRNIISPKFKEEKYYEGLNNAIDEINKLTTDKTYLDKETLNSFDSAEEYFSNMFKSAAFWKYLFTGNNFWILIFVLFLILWIVTSIFRLIYRLATGNKFNRNKYTSIKDINKNEASFWKWLFILDLIFRNNNRRGKGGGFHGWGGGFGSGGFSGGGGSFGGGGSSGKW